MSLRYYSAVVNMGDRRGLVKPETAQRNVRERVQVVERDPPFPQQVLPEFPLGRQHVGRLGHLGQVRHFLKGRPKTGPAVSIRGAVLVTLVP